MAGNNQLIGREADLYAALCKELVEHPLKRDGNGYVRLKSRPHTYKFESAAVRAMSRSTISRTLNALWGKKLYEARRKGGNDWSWWVKLPRRETESWLDHFAAFAAELPQMVDELREVVAQRDAAELALGDAQGRIQELESENKQLKADNEAAAAVSDNIAAIKAFLRLD